MNDSIDIEDLLYDAGCEICGGKIPEEKWPSVYCYDCDSEHRKTKKESLTIET